MTKDISVIIVSFNNQTTIKSCLDSVIKNSPSIEIIVVDNHSQDKTTEVVKKFKQVKLIKSEENLGFSKANNLGAKQAIGKYLIFLNPDTKVLGKQALLDLMKDLKEDLALGVVGPKLILPDGNLQKSVRNKPTIINAIKEYLLGKKGAFEFYDPDCEELCVVETIAGACLVMKRETFKKVGGWDEKYFLYFEDIDLCDRIRNLGLKVGYDPRVVIEHQVGVSGKNQRTRELSLESTKKYYGNFVFFLIQYISRIGNKLRS